MINFRVNKFHDIKLTLTYTQGRKRDSETQSVKNWMIRDTKCFSSAMICNIISQQHSDNMIHLVRRNVNDLANHYARKFDFFPKPSLLARASNYCGGPSR